MIEELKVIADIFQTTTDNALYAFIGYGVYKLSNTALIVIPTYKAVRFFIDRLFVKPDTQDE